MTESVFPEIDKGNLTLRKDSADLESLGLFFQVFLGADVLLVTSAEQSQPKDGIVTFTGQTSGWGNEPAEVELVYQANPVLLQQLTLSKPITEFAGLSLHEDFKISGLQLLVHAILPAEGEAGFAQVFREIKGKLLLRPDLSIDFTVQNPVASAAMLVEVETELGLSDAAHLLGSAENPEQDLTWLPAELRDSSLLSLRDLQFRISPDEGLTFVSVTLAVAEGHLWPIIPGVSWLAVGGLSLTLAVDYPLKAAYRFPVFSVTGMIQVGEPNTKDGLIAITARWPDFAISGGLVEGSTIKIGDLLRRSGLTTEGVPDTLAISHLSFNAEPSSDPKLFDFFIAIDGWSFKFPNSTQVLDITELSLALNYSSAPDVGMGGQFTGKFTIAGIDLFVQATHTSAGAGWQFQGGTGPGQKIPITALLDDLKKRMGVSDLPDRLNDLPTIENLQIAIDTQAKSFFFTIGGKFTVNGTPVDAVLTIDLKRGANNYSSFVSGKILISQLEFDLIFNRDKVATMFLASYQNLAGGALPIANLLEAVNADEAALAVAKDIEIDLKDALFVYDKLAASVPAPVLATNPPPASTGRVLFALDVGGGINLSNLPFVGKLFPNDQSLRAMFQPIITSADFSKDDIVQVKQLIPPGGILLAEAENGYTARLVISGTLQIGDKAFPFEQAITDAQKQALPRGSGGGSVSPAPALPPQPSAKTDNVKWFDVQKSLGPVSFKRVGVQFDSGILWFLLDGSLAAGPLNIALDGLAAGSSLKEFEPQFSLRGMSVDFSQGGVEIGGAFLRVPGQNGEEDEFDGMAVIRAEVFTLSALGSYTRRQGHPSLFIYGVLDYPLGGPAFFFITGLAAGFGYNRSLKMPPVDQVDKFPLVAQAITPPGKAQDLVSMLDSLRIYVPPDIGQIFFCAGIRFSTFKLIDSFALLAIQFGNQFEIDLLGLSTLVVPPPEEGDTVTPLAEVQMDLKATFAPDEGFFGIQAQLTANSFILSRACHLTGGFAFFTWFKDGYLGGKAGDFVITLGGYHPAYRKPAYYPDVPRVGFNWQLSKEFSIKGGMYFALTGNALMAGGSLQALWDSGSLKAWFLIGADFLIAWKPFHYDAAVYLDMGISFTFNLFGTHTITLELGADLHIWGPEFSGVARLHILIFTITINFGADSTPQPMPLDWPTFRTSFLPANDKVCSVMVQRGLVNQPSASNDDLGIINPKDFSLVINSAIPVKSFKVGTDHPVERPVSGDIHIGSMAITDESLKSDVEIIINITVNNQVTDISDTFTVTPIQKNVPAGLWGQNLTPDLNAKAMIENVVTGFELTPGSPPVPGETYAIERKNLRYETTISSSHLRGSANLPLIRQARLDARQQIENTLLADSQAEARSRLLKNWGFREDQEVHLLAGYATNLMGNPRIV
jgi:hypothetical protein